MFISFKFFKLKNKNVDIVTFRVLKSYGIIFLY